MGELSDDARIGAVLRSHRSCGPRQRGRGAGEGRRGPRERRGRRELGSVSVRTHTGMSLPRVSLPRLARLALSRTIARDSCSPVELPPCPPCEPKLPPPCRARAPDRVRAVRVTCCPPPRGRRPPCPAPPGPCARTCEDVSAPAASVAGVGVAHLVVECGGERDRVASRLQAAEDARRADYLREVAARRPQPPPPPAHYRLPAERDCLRATDGHRYTLAPDAAPAPALAGCGPCRMPPPPRCVEIVPDNECQVRKTPKLDPCAHRPRVILEIDRSARPQGEGPRGTEEINRSTICAQRPQGGGSQCGGPQSVGPQVNVEGFTERIMKKLKPCAQKLGDSIGSTPCPPPAPGAARHAGDTAWCGTLRLNAAAAPRCRPAAPGVLRRRPCRPPPPPPAPLPCTRRLHTAAPRDLAALAARSQADADKLAGVLQQRGQLRAAGRGREVPCGAAAAGAGAGAGPRSHGGLQLAVPRGAAAVRVDVSLLDAPAPPAPPERRRRSSPPHIGTPPARSLARDPRATKIVVSTAGSKKAKTPPRPICVNRAVSPLEKRESWFSLKNIQKKVAFCYGNTERPRNPCVDPCPPRPPPCRPAGPDGPPAAPAAPAAPGAPADAPVPLSAPLPRVRRGAPAPPPQPDNKPSVPSCCTPATAPMAIIL